jgi:hypothetical protein
MNRVSRKIWEGITSLSLTITCLAFLMVLVVACTLAQVRLGTLGAVNLYMRSWFYWVPLGGLSIPIFPGGALVGLVLMVNLVAAQARRLEFSARKAGIWVVHAGLIVLVVGEFVTGGFQVDSRLVFEEGETVNYVQDARGIELAVVETTDPAFDDVYGVPETTLARGGTVQIPNGPLALRVKRFHRNSQLFRAASPADAAGVDQGAGVGLGIRPLPPVTVDDRADLSVAVVEVVAGDKSLGTFLASNGIEAPQVIRHEGRTFELSLRGRREYLPYTLTLKDFTHDVYPGTGIPKNFSSLVRLVDPGKGEDRDVLIYMNSPLRYGGKAFYQASFGKNDTLSILQVVENPGWLLPYLSTLLVTVGLLVHFGISLRRGARRPGDDAREA